jgi:hypothetical protein
MLWVRRGHAWSYKWLASELAMSVAEAHNAVQRAREAGLLPEGELSAPPSPIPIQEFLIHGARYAFPAKLGLVTRSYPSTHAAPPLRDELQGDDVIVEVATNRGYIQVKDFLRFQGFRNDSCEGAPICRWRRQELLLDLMLRLRKIASSEG